MALSRPAISLVRHREKSPVRSAATTTAPKDLQVHEGSAIVTYVTINTPAGAPHETAAAKSHKKPAHAQEGKEEEYDDADMDIVQADAPSADRDEDDLVGYASTVAVVKRDYSIVAHTTTVSPKVDVAPEPAGEGCPLPAPAPYVPNASFSFQRIQDSSYPGAQYVYMQQMASKQVEQAILKMRKELQWQLKILQQSSAKEIPDLKQKQQIIIEQLKLQQQYLEKQQQLQKKLERVGKKRVIVVI